MAHSLCEDTSTASTKRALVITPRTTTAVLVPLRDAIRRELEIQGIAKGPADAKTRECLDRVMLSCVFDLDGLWEVLADLDRPASPQPDPDPDDGVAITAGDPLEAEVETAPVLEIQDSEDEEDLSPLASPAQSQHAQPGPPPSAGKTSPEIIVITHFSTLLTNLFTHREKSAAHSALQLLSSHLHHLARTLPSQPLILILNSTAADAAPSRTSKQPQLDASLRSVFNPPSLPGYAYGGGAARRNKPSFGLVFAQLLDMHLLCTRIPGEKDDADAVYAPAGAADDVRFVTVVEVLLDDTGVWEGKRGQRKSREQRWTAVDLVGGRVQRAFPPTQQKVPEQIRISAGFGGRRV